MNFSAASSRSAVVTPSRTLLSSNARVRTRISPAAAMRSISSGVFLTITARLRLELVLEPERGDRGADVIVDLGRRAGAVEASQQAALLVERDELGRLVVIDPQALADGLGFVVVALRQLGAVLIADPLLLGRIELDVVGVAGLLADAPARQSPDDLLVRRLDQQHRGQGATELVERLVERLGLLGVAGEAVEQEAVIALTVVHAAQDHPDDHLVGDEVSAVHVLLGLLAEVGALLDLRAQHVARRDVGQVEVLGEAFGLGALPRTGWSQQDDVEL